jgi:integrase
MTGTRKRRPPRTCTPRWRRSSAPSRWCAQTILGHTRISTTLEIYTDTDEHARRDALTRLHGLLDQDNG